MTHGIPDSVYHVYEAKRLAEKTPSVGQKTVLHMVSPGKQLFYVGDFEILDSYFNEFSPRSTDIDSRAVFSCLIEGKRVNFHDLKQAASPNPQHSTDDPSPQPPSQE